MRAYIAIAGSYFEGDHIVAVCMDEHSARKALDDLHEPRYVCNYEFAYTKVEVWEMNTSKPAATLHHWRRFCECKRCNVLPKKAEAPAPESTEASTITEAAS